MSDTPRTRHCACLLVERELPDFSGAPHEWVDTCGYHSKMQSELTAARAELETYRDSCAAKADRIDRLGEQVVKLTAEVETLKRWRETVIDAAVVGWTYCAADDADPRGCLSRIMAANAQIALDPAVSSLAEALVERGRQEMRAEVETLRALLTEACETIDTLPGYPTGADLCDRIDAALAKERA